MERIATPAATRRILEKHGFFLQKKYGQNFLIDSNILDKIVDCAEVSAEDHILEIGPGIGSLTQALAERAGSVTAVEIDKRLIPILEETMQTAEHFQLIEGDILKLPLDTLLEKLGPKAKVVANLPYYITTPIVMELLRYKEHLKSITVMVQKEVAERMQAGPGTKDYGSLSVAVQYHCKADLQMVVPPSCFMPPPKVGSAVITLEVLSKPRILVEDESLFFEVVRCAFGQRRKTLVNGLFHLGSFGLSKEELTEMLESLGFSGAVRGEALSPEELGKVANRLFVLQKPVAEG